jgi:hypothetical protein
MDELPAYFRVSEDRFEPLAPAASGWTAQMINGPALCAILARALEKDYSVEGFIPARLTVDLFSPARFEPLTVATAQVRSGNRIQVADATAVQGGKVVARASAVLLKASQQPPGERWIRDEQPLPPSPDLVATTKRDTTTLWYSDKQGQWSEVVSEHQNATRKLCWQRPIATVTGEQSSQFLLAAVAAEATSIMTNWGTEGIGFINADLTVALARLPVGHEIGVAADSHVAADGVAVGTATLFDRHGSFGTGMVIALANAARAISFAEQDMPAAVRERYRRSDRAPEE